MKNFADSMFAEQLINAGFDPESLPKELELLSNHKHFIKTPVWVLELVSKNIISAKALYLYGIIGSFCQYNKAFTWVSKKKLAEKAGISLRHVYRLLNELEVAGAIYIHTIKTANNTEKSVIFLLNKRNMGQMSSMRHNYLPSKHTDKMDSKVLSKPTRGYCQNSQSLTVTDGRRNTYRDIDRRRGEIEFNGERTRSHFGTEGAKVLWFNKRFEKLDRDIFESILEMVKKYYRYVNRKFNIHISPRLSDVANAYELVTKFSITANELYEFTKAHMHEPYFLASNKHLSVWKNPILVNKLIDHFYIIQTEYEPSDEDVVVPASSEAYISNIE